MPIDERLQRAIEAIHFPAGWVHLGTIGKSGEPHVTPVMMAIIDGELIFSITGKQKKKNLERDPRVCVELAGAGNHAHVVIWGTMTLSDDTAAQILWDRLIVAAFGESGLEKRRRTLSPGATSLAVLTPTRWRIAGF